MKILKLVRWNDHQDLQEKWLDAAELTLTKVHANRKKEWALSRVALELAFQEGGLLLSPQHHFISYHQVAEHPQVMFSLSHSKEWAGAFLLWPCSGLGVDIELIGREVPESVITRMSHPQDVQQDKLLIWTAKEAIYKSLPQEIQTKIWLNKIAVGEGVYFIEGFDLQGQWEKIEHSVLTGTLAYRK